MADGRMVEVRRGADRYYVPAAELVELGRWCTGGGEGDERWERLCAVRGQPNVYVHRAWREVWDPN